MPCLPACLPAVLCLCACCPVCVSPPCSNHPLAPFPGEPLRWNSYVYEDGTT